jgi:hypothetical protein
MKQVDMNPYKLSNPITISSVSDFTEIVSNVNDHLRRNGAEFNEVLLFRGHSDKDYQLLPNIGRNRKFSTHISILNEERNLIEMAKFKMPDVFKNDMPPVELLALLQHYGIPTRLLDITENALVALYFSCGGDPKKDGEVILFVNNELDVTNYPLINAIADSYRFARFNFLSLSLFYKDVITQPYFIEQLNTVNTLYETDEAGGRWIELCCKKPLFIYSPVRSLRQLFQQGRYILFPNVIETQTSTDELERPREIKYFDLKINPIDKDDPCVSGRIIIPAERKSIIRKQLRLFGICEESLFADNTDRVCKSISENFKRKISGKGY